MKKRQGRSVPSHGHWLPTGAYQDWAHEFGKDPKTGKTRVRLVRVPIYTLAPSNNRYSRGNWGGQSKEKARAARRVAWSQ